MVEQRRTGLWLAAAAVMLAAVLVWWFARGRDGSDDDSAQTPEHADASSRSSAGAGTNKSPPKLDLAGAPKAAISGTVRDPEGRPIEGAQVCAFSNSEARRGLEDRQLHCARSGPDGYYRIDGLLPVPTEVHASAATFKPNQWEERREGGRRRDQVPLRAGQTAEHIDLILQPGGVLVTGVVKDIAGGEIEGAQVMASGDWTTRSDARAVTLSGEEGRFELWTQPGSLAVFAYAEGYAMGWVSAVAPGEFVELFMTPESVLVGKVVLASGEPVEGVMVTAGGWNDASARTDASGRFRIDRLQPGVYKPIAEGDELYGQAAEQVHLGLGETSDEVVIRVHPAVYVEGHVMIAGSERPCTQGSVRLDNQGVHNERAQLDDEGHVEFRGVLAGEYRVFVTCEDHVAEDEYEKLVVGGENIGGLVWQVREGLAIRGEVVDEAGQPVEKVEINARPLADPDAARSQLTSARNHSEQDGSFVLGGLLPGRYELSTASWRGRPGPVDPITVELQSGADVNDVRIVMPSLGSIRGRVVDETGKPVSGANLTASLVGGQDSRTARSNDAGEFTIENVRPGQSRVTATGDSWSKLRKPGTTDDDIQGEVVEVVANEVAEVTITVEARDGQITGVVKDEGGGVVADAFIDVERMSEKAGANAASARQDVRWSWGSEPVLTDADGRFVLDELPEGKFIVRAHRKGGGEAVLEEVALGSHIELVIASTGELAGTVKLADGGAPERFTVTIEDRTAGIYLRDSFFRTDGAWRVRELPAGTYEIGASSSEGSVMLEPPIELAEGELRGDLELVLDPRLTLRGRVVDLETGEPIAGIEVFVSGLSFSFRSSDAERRNVSGPDGRFELDNVPAGRIELVAWNRGAGSKGKYDYFRRPMTIAAEPLVQDIGDLELVARRLEENQDFGYLGYDLTAWDPSKEPSEWEAVVAFVHPGGPADGTGLAAGDVIEKFDGHDVLGVNSGRYYTLSRVPEGTKVTLELRGGKEVEIVAGAPIY